MSKLYKNQIYFRLLFSHSVYSEDGGLFMPTSIPVLDKSLKEAMEVNAFARFVKKSLNLPSVYLINRGKKTVKKVAICGGAAGGCFKLALDEGYDIYVSGDAPHHIRHDVNCYQFNYLEIWHEAEQIFIPVMARRLKALDKKLKIIMVNQPYPKVI